MVAHCRRWRKPKPEIQRSDHAMMPRRVPAPRKAANDNVMLSDRGPARSAPALSRSPRCDAPLARPEAFRVGVRPLLMAGFSGLILVALSGACLIALAAIGLVAGTLGSFGLLGRHLGWPGRTLGTPDPQVLGYRP